MCSRSIPSSSGNNKRRCKISNNEIATLHWMDNNYTKKGNGSIPTTKKHITNLLSLFFFHSSLLFYFCWHTNEWAQCYCLPQRFISRTVACTHSFICATHSETNEKRYWTSCRPTNQTHSCNCTLFIFTRLIILMRLLLLLVVVLDLMRDAVTVVFVAVIATNITAVPFLCLFVSSFCTVSKLWSQTQCIP